MSFFANPTVALITAILSLAAGVVAYITKLRSEIAQHQTQIAQLQEQAQSKDFQDALTKVVSNVKESTLDFNDAANQFIKQYGDGSGDVPPKT